MIENWYIHIILAYVVTLIPIIGKYFAALNTMFHEDGHALSSMLLGGRVKRISLFSNTEGEAITASRFWIGRVITSYAGYTFSSLIAFVCFFLISVGEVKYVLYGFIGFAVVNLVLWVRNFYGIIWLISFISLCGVLLYYGSENLQIFITFFLSAIILTQSVSTAFIILVLSFKDSKNAGDATNLAKHTFIVPAFIWGMLFFGQSVYIAFLVFRNFII